MLFIIIIFQAIKNGKLQKNIISELHNAKSSFSYLQVRRFRGASVTILFIAFCLCNITKCIRYFSIFLRFHWWIIIILFHYFNYHFPPPPPQLLTNFIMRFLNLNYYFFTKLLNGIATITEYELVTHIYFFLCTYIVAMFLSKLILKVWIISKQKFFPW